MSDDRLLFRELKGLCGNDSGRGRLCSAILSFGIQAFEDSNTLRAVVLKAMPYRVYLMTEHWRALSQKAKDNAGNRCQLCNKPGNLEAHHRTYERRGHEADGDLTVLCDDCHERFHKSSGIPDDALGPPVVNLLDMQIAGMTEAEELEWFSKLIAEKRREQGLTEPLGPSSVSSTLKGSGT